MRAGEPQRRHRLGGMLIKELHATTGHCRYVLPEAKHPPMPWIECGAFRSTRFHSHYFLNDLPRSGNLQA